MKRWDCCSQLNVYEDVDLHSVGYGISRLPMIPCIAGVPVGVALGSGCVKGDGRISPSYGKED